MAMHRIVGGTSTFQKSGEAKVYRVGDRVDLTDAELMSAVRAGVRFDTTEPKEGEPDLPRHLLLAAKQGDQEAKAVTEQVADAQQPPAQPSARK